MSIFQSFLTLANSVESLGKELGFRQRESGEYIEPDEYEGSEPDMTPFEEDMPETLGADV